MDTALLRPSSLDDPALHGVLERLHRAARSDWKTALGVLPRYVLGRLAGKTMMEALTPGMLRQMYIPVSLDAGRWLYQLARAVDAKRIVEFGASFGISTLYLAAAARDNGAGEVITTEIEPGKCQAAELHIREAGLDGYACVLEGDALETLPTVAGPVDLLFLDGWKNLYLPVLELMLSRLRPGAVIVADNIAMAEVRPYLARVRSSPEFVSGPLPGGGMECTFYLGGRADG